MPCESFWTYSCRVYQQASVSSTCLSLQNEQGQDVNLILFAAWYGHTRGALPEQLVQQAVSFSQPWAQGVVRPLRQSRTWLKLEGQRSSANTDDEREALLAIREQIKSLELRTERYQQTHLEALVQAPAEHLSATAQRAAMHANLLVIATLSTTPSAALQHLLQVLLNELCAPLPSV